MARLSKLACPASANDGSLSSLPVPPAPMVTGRLQQTLADCVERQGKALHSGKVSTVRLCPERASRGRRVPNSNVEEVGLTVATDLDGKSVEKMAPHVNEPVYAWRNDSFVAAFPSEVVRITYGINFSQVFVPGSNSCPLLWRVLSDSASQKYDSPQIVPSSIFVIGSSRL
ncbi:putative UDP-3-O-acyl-N-acetylglucosamine deacetylase 5, mitochondrial [Glycine soja]|uniref:Putative UDP-3-O-acyl-N-acetylglucosamine deacetylase 5, mitochondrial n=1 Tax=Glycine soja TaxID=3848 RepID=A0A445IFH9_GLYSO|nr:putative UDP-3-O-acyl-N-acetylglucosamine deacetylase 5, mitochondrial [Glycine soja]